MRTSTRCEKQEKEMKYFTVKVITGFQINYQKVWKAKGRGSVFCHWQQKLKCDRLVGRDFQIIWSTSLPYFPPFSSETKRLGDLLKAFKLSTFPLFPHKVDVWVSLHFLVFPISRKKCGVQGSGAKCKAHPPMEPWPYRLQLTQGSRSHNGLFSFI